MSAPVVVVFGATGAQGGSVVRQLFASDSKFEVRAVTRNPSSDASKELQQKYPALQLVQANANDKDSVSKALHGATYAFFVTNFWDPEQKMDAETDLKQGKIMADAALAQGVKFVVWSSLHDVDGLTKDSSKLHAPHFSNKYKVEEYIRSIGLPAGFVYAGFYAANWQSFPLFAPGRDSDGSLVLRMPIRADVGLPVVDIEADFGQFVVPMFQNPTKFQHARVLAATAYLTLADMVRAYESVNGEPVRVVRTSYDAVPLEELRATTRWFNERGYYDGEDLELCRALYAPGSLNLHTFRDWIQRTGFKVPA